MTMAAADKAEVARPAWVPAQQVPDHELMAIHKRLRSRLSDEGARNWYPTDVAALLGEVQYLRQTISRMAVTLTSGPPLNDVPATTPPLEIVDKVVEAWTGREKDLWEKQQVRLLRERLHAQGKDLGAANAHVAELLVEIEQLKAELRGFGRVRDDLAVSEEARQIAEVRISELLRQVRSLEAEVRENARIRDESEAIRQSQSAMISRFSERIDRLRILNIEMTSIIGTA